MLSRVVLVLCRVVPVLSHVVLVLPCVVLCVSCCTSVASCCTCVASCCVVLSRVVLVLCRVVTRVVFQTRSSNSYAGVKGTNESTEELYQVTSALNHYHLESGNLIGSHQREHLLKMDSTDDFSQDSKTD